jgi:hypothetical protein
LRRNTDTAKTNRKKSQFEVWGATIRTYLPCPSGSLPTTRHRMIFNVICDITRNIGLITGVVKSVYFMFISGKDDYFSVISCQTSTFDALI